VNISLRFIVVLTWFNFPVNGINGLDAYLCADRSEVVFDDFNQNIVLSNVQTVEFNIVENMK
jgi:hypothetical protein